MLKLHESALAILAVFLTATDPIFPPVVMIGLSIVCLSALSVTLISAVRRNWPGRSDVAPRRALYTHPSTDV